MAGPRRAGARPTVAMVFVQQAVAALAPAQREAALAEAGIVPGLLLRAQARVPAPAFGALWLAAARLLDDEFFGLDRRRMKVGSFALLCHAAAVPGPLLAAVRRALGGLALFMDDLQPRLLVQGGEARIELQHRDPAALDPTRRLFADETVLVMAYGLLCWLAGRRVPLRALALAHPRPVHHVEYAGMFCTTLHFGAAATAVSFDAAALAGRVRATPASVASFLRAAPVSVFLKRPPQRAWADRVRACLRQHGAAIGLAGAAQQLATSAATLRRHLAAEGTGWQPLKDEWRRSRAFELLASGRTPVAEVAATLGFAEASAFSRAFRHWTGSTPGAWRAHRLVPPPDGG